MYEIKILSSTRCNFEIYAADILVPQIRSISVILETVKIILSFTLSEWVL